MSNIEKELEDFLREKLSERLTKLSDNAKNCFYKIFSDEVLSKDLITAITLCDRTIESNNKVNE